MRLWSGGLDSNQRPPAPHADTLPGCATTRKFTSSELPPVKWAANVNGFSVNMKKQPIIIESDKVGEKPFATSHKFVSCLLPYCIHDFHLEKRV